MNVLKMAKIQRIGENFNNELEKIKDKRLSMGIDKFRASTRKLTDLIIKHNLWIEIREDLLNYKFKEDNKKC
jgi:hypothetical protein